MSNLSVEIEALVLEGVPLTEIQGRRMAQMVELALSRLLEQRGTESRHTGLEDGASQPSHSRASVNVHVPSGANEARWAEEVAMVLYRAVDRTL